MAKNQYGETFSTILTKEERQKVVKKGTGEIGRKLKNKKMCLEAPEKYEKKKEEAIKKFIKTSAYKKATGGIMAIEDENSFLVDEKLLISACMDQDLSIDNKLFAGYYGETKERFEALDGMLTTYINMDFDFDFSTDESFAAERIRLEHIEKSGEAIITVLMHNSDYWTSLPEDTRAMLTEKSVQAAALVKYSKARTSVINNNYYSTHLDAELSFAGEAPMNLISLQADMWSVETAYEELLEVGSEKTQHELELDAINIVENRGTVQAHRPSFGVMKDIERKSVKQNTGWADIFGYPLKTMSRFMRDKRTDNHGRKKFDICKKLYKLFPKHLSKIDEDNKVVERKFEEKYDAAPEINLSKYFNDPVKNALRIELNSNNSKVLLEYAKGKPELKPIADMFKEFIEAANMYADIKAIVNSDTTEMEMAFIDKMQEIRDFVSGEALLSNAEDIEPYLSFMNICLDPVLEMGRGKLRGLLSDAKYRELDENLAAIIQDTGISDNMDESNIKNIPLFTHMPNINDVKQSTIGDCYLVASMTTLVSADPDAILSMFYDMGDGNVLVRLFDGEPLHPVYVKLRKHYETGEGNASDCVWPQLIEKAYAACGINKKGIARVDSKGYLTDLEKELTLGCCEVSLSHLTGTRFTAHNDHINPNVDVVRQKEVEIKHAYTDNMDDEEYWDLLSKGMPAYIADRVFCEVSDSDRTIYHVKAMEQMVRSVCRNLCDEIGTVLMQYKKVCLRKNLPYREVIEAYAARVGLPLAADWDANNIALVKLMDSDEKFEEAFDINKDFQRWPTMFDIDGMIKKYEKLLNSNLDTILEKKAITASAGELEFDVFNHNRLNDIANDLVRLANKTENTEGAENLILQSLECIQAGFLVDEDEKTGFALKEAEQIKADDEYREKYSKMAYVQKYMLDDVRNPGARTFLRQLAESLSGGGSMTLSINHFVSAIDMEYKLYEWYVLIKDPFNVYNRTYKTVDIQFGEPIIEKKEEAFMDVLSVDGRQIKRHLDENGNDENSCYGGFRGLSWWRVDDLMKEMKYFVPVNGNQIKKTMV